MLERSLPNRAPPPPGWDADDVGGVPWHLREAYTTAEAVEARLVAEACMCRVISDCKELRDSAMGQMAGIASATRIVTMAVGRRVVCSHKGATARGLYQPDGRILDDATSRPMTALEFVRSTGSKDMRPLRSLVLESNEGEAVHGSSLEQLSVLHGYTTAAPTNAQADPHCRVCGGGESETGNEILLCDGMGCEGCYHQQCVMPHVPEVPEGAWLCQSCVAGGNCVDPQVVEDERRAAEAAGGVESMRVLSNDGVGEQDVPLLTEVLDVIDSSLPLIGRINAAKLVFAPDHQTLVLLRSTESVRRVLGAIVLKPHCARGFLEVAFCVVRKEEQRNGVGSRLMTYLKEHAQGTLGVLHLLTYADDSATGFFERLGFDVEPQAGMGLDRFHWGISHYIGSQLRQCVLDPDGATLYSHDFPRKLPAGGRRLFPPKPPPSGAGGGEQAGGGEAAVATKDAAAANDSMELG